MLKISIFLSDCKMHEPIIISETNVDRRLKFAAFIDNHEKLIHTKFQVNRRRFEEITNN